MANDVSDPDQSVPDLPPLDELSYVDNEDSPNSLHPQWYTSNVTDYILLIIVVLIILFFLIPGATTDSGNINRWINYVFSVISYATVIMYAYYYVTVFGYKQELNILMIIFVFVFLFSQLAQYYIKNPLVSMLSYIAALGLLIYIPIMASSYLAFILILPGLYLIYQIVLLGIEFRE
jgi:hypothetical protein